MKNHFDSEGERDSQAIKKRKNKSFQTVFISIYFWSTEKTLRVLEFQVADSGFRIPDSLF